MKLAEVNWNSLASVVKFAGQWDGMTITKHAGRPNYNICHTSRRDVWDRPNVKVVWQDGAYVE